MAAFVRAEKLLEWGVGTGATPTTRNLMSFRQVSVRCSGFTNILGEGILGPVHTYTFTNVNADFYARLGLLVNALQSVKVELKHSRSTYTCIWTVELVNAHVII